MWLAEAELLSAGFRPRRVPPLDACCVVLVPLSKNDSSMEQSFIPLKGARQSPAKSEEKGSDVNLASFLLLDAFKNDYDVAAVVSNDTDLITLIEMVKREFGHRIFVFNPHDRASWHMRNAASASKDYRRIRSGVRATSQLPPTLTDVNASEI